MTVLDYLGPALAGLVFIALMSWVPMPARQRFNAVFVGGAGAAYLSGGGFGPWELAYVVPATAVAYLGLRDVRWIGVAWAMHTGWDVVHHLYGNPLWPFVASSSHGCAIMDAVIAVWFLLGAPTSFRAEAAAPSSLTPST